jgi:DNA-directed RNA polymerase subunit RPC12/RpoP
MEKTENDVKLISEITCPHCSHRSKETMPTDA